MDNIVKISIIIPVYNQDKFIKQCIESLIGQTLKDIEIIIVNDASTDASEYVINNYCKKDHRIVKINLDKNYGTSVARKRGVSVARGKYIMFLDSDDTLTNDACKIVWDEMEKDPVDILHFSTNVKYCDQFSKYDKKNLYRILKPYNELCDGDLVKKSFEEHKWGFSLWNKAYNAEICKKSFSKLQDDYIVVSEDLYVFFILSYFGSKYRGINEKIYNYNFGCGITNINKMSLVQFKKYCTRLYVPNALFEFLKKEELSPKSYLKIVKQLKQEFLNEVLYQWMECLSINDARAGYDFLIQLLGPKTFISALARNYWYNGPKILERIARRNEHRICGKKVQKIGVYYHRIRNGGVEKVISLLISIWIKSGYKIVLITDEKPQNDDYSLPEYVERVVIYNYLDSNEKQYKKRAKHWEQIIDNYNLDTIIYNSCNCYTILWDMCMIKGMQCNAIVMAHSMFSGTMWYSPIFASFLPFIYRLVDCVVALSSVDVSFWKNFCPAYYIPNPITLISQKEVALLNKKNVLWVGRLSPEKKPSSVLRVFEIVHQVIPEATLTVVGDGDNPDNLEDMETLACELGIDESVDFVGFQKEVSKYYKNAAVVVITSLCESFSMVLAESKNFGVPTVMFELPNLEMTRTQRGLIQVPQDDIYSMANKVIELLNNDKTRRALGKEARNSLEELAKVDISKEWQTVFESVEYNHIDQEIDNNVSLMLDLLFKDFMRGLEFIQNNSTKMLDTSDNNLVEIVQRLNSYEVVLNRHEEVVNRHEEVVNRHEEVVNRHEEVANRHEEVVNRHEEVVNRHEEIVNRHEEVVNRHEEVVNRHEEVVNQDWEWLKTHENRLIQLEEKKSFLLKSWR